MDTKSKKSTAIISAIAFFLGLSLILSGVTPLVWHLSECWQNGKSPIENFQPDYQQTSDFRDIVSAYFETFATMATGGPLEYSLENTRMALYEESMGSSASEVMLQSNVSAEDLQEYYRYDINLLYEIYYGNNLRYSNTENALDRTGQSLPDGYNFLLYFDGERAHLYQNGREIDPYGDGLYHGTEDWFLPGYVNFNTDERMENVQIVMAVRQKTVPVLTGFYGQDGASYEETSIFYELDCMHRLYYWELVLAVGFVGIGLLFLIPALLMKKSRRTAHTALQNAMGKIWLEAKVLLFVVSLFFLAVLALECGYSYYVGTVYAFYSPVVCYDWPSITKVQLYAYLPVVLSAFWIGYLTLLDLCGKPWKNSLIGKIIRTYRRPNKELPFGAKMRHLCIFFFVSTLFLIAGFFVAALLFLLFTANPGFWYEPTDYIFFFTSSLLIAILMLAVTFFYTRRCLKIFRETDDLSSRISDIRSGIFSETPILPEKAELYPTAQDLQDIQQGMDSAIEERIRSERMKVELITNVSHDLKTPLTSIISYTELLAGEELSDQASDYVQILRNKAQRLKSMVQDIFEVSKAASGQLPVQMEPIDLAKLLRQTLADMSEAIEASSVTIKSSIPTDPIPIVADGQRLYRVFQNLIQNALQYSLEGSRVYLQTEIRDGVAEVRIKNVSKNELPEDVDFTERFVRGDASRSDGGSGLGLSIAQSFTEACGGSFSIEIDADRFTAVVTLPLHSVSQ
ncbi:MAG: sensor histidine kinase [Candidatus Merdivicinus sp.]